ncbi:hypothetical protein HanRHA438_Chr07g0299901 [Helianthus annuus]|nr:hypothetical protein HanRHA438_Chr07g0299901 [Helianthus annuus]
MSSIIFQFRNSFFAMHEFNYIQVQKLIFCTPCTRVGLVVKHVIKLQWSSKDFTL